LGWDIPEGGGGHSGKKKRETTEPETPRKRAKKNSGAGLDAE
jgi:hypothetical protein